MKSKIFILAVVFVSLSSWSLCQQQVSAKVDSLKAKEIEQLLDLMKAGEFGQTILEQVFSRYDKMMPEARLDDWVNIKKQFHAEDFLHSLVPIYDKYFTAQEIKELNKFFSSSAGSKFITKMPEITNDTYEAGQNWGTEVNKTLQEKLKQAGILNKVEPEKEQMK